MNGKPVIPDHKLTVIPLKDKDEAYYLAGLLNSSITRYVVKSYAINIQMDPHIMGNAKVPKYNLRDPLHKKISELSHKLHKLTPTDSALLDKMERGIDTIVAQIWKISEKELKVIQRELKKCLRR